MIVCAKCGNAPRRKRQRWCKRCHADDMKLRRRGTQSTITAGAAVDFSGTVAEH